MYLNSKSTINFGEYVGIFFVKQKFADFIWSNQLLVNVNRAYYQLFLSFKAVIVMNYCPFLNVSSAHKEIQLGFLPCAETVLVICYVNSGGQIALDLL